MALNTKTTILKCLEVCQDTISKINGVPTQAIDETKNNINYIRSTIDVVIDNSIDVFNAIKNGASSFSIIAGLGDKIRTEQDSTQGFATPNDFIVNDRVADRYSPFMTISTDIAGGETGAYSGIARGNIVKLDGESIPNILGKSLINNMLYAVNNFSIQDLGYATNEQTNNIVLLIETFKYLMLMNVCRIAIRTEYFSQEEVIETSDAIGEAFFNYLDDLSKTESEGSTGIGVGTNSTQVNNNKLYESADRMRETIITQLLIESEDIPNSYDYKAKTDADNSILVAYDKYEDIDRNQEVYERNREKIKHPGFLPGGDTIRILSR